ncbi:uncharacterized protein LOC110664378 isoform X2 [Hevea brasiliensis]|uniref:uncharacterized protein LOC110664378 isoform X2 n=1 Tax=Hevea brasiliensis TaxID=3981 RepID=UPI0025D90410|nr:uncharacterized protein LOC110664378 isoform X2 [Hevea brasiliensis]
MGKRETQSVEANTNPNSLINDDQSPKMSPYELSREERIKSNRERMQKLGLVDLSLKLHSLTASKRTPRNNPSSAKHPSPLQQSGPLRRSSRLHNATPVSYSEAVLAKKNGLLEDEDVRLEVGSKPEVYTEKHEKLLGNTERSWALFVDGYGKDGKRIYDQVKGKTCHQCRYGEHVLEAIENPNWICPVCRGICNCSLCRQSKGWAPTGALYRKISSLGYKSVAHYLIQTQRSQNTSEKDSVTVSQVSAKRSLPFSDMEIPSERPPIINDENIGQYEDTTHDELKIKKEKQLPNSRNLTTDGQTNMGSVEVNHEANECLGFSEPNSEGKREIEAHSENMESSKANHDVCYGHAGLSKPPIFEDERESEFKGEKKQQLQSTDEEHDNCNIVLESCPKLETKRALAFKPNLDSIAARLRQGHQKTNCQGNVEPTGVNEKNSDVKPSVNMFSNQEEPKEEELHVEEDKCTDGNIILDTSPKLKKKTARTAEPNPDSIGGRLRQRRRMGQGIDKNGV